jgi:hypothetical protein
VNKGIFRAVVGLDEALAALRVKPFYRTECHYLLRAQKQTMRPS